MRGASRQIGHINSSFLRDSAADDVRPFCALCAVVLLSLMTCMIVSVGMMADVIAIVVLLLLLVLVLSVSVGHDDVI